VVRGGVSFLGLLSEREKDMLQVRKFVIALVAMTAICGSSVYAARSCSGDVLVVPSRFTIIQLAFDVVALRDVTLIAYKSSGVDEEPVLYIWDKNLSAWKDITIDEYAIGSFSATTPSEIILIGSDNDLPASLISGASQAKKVTRIDSLNVAPVINALNKDMKFTTKEWELLAERHGLKITDRNEERRRWGRYGPPGQDKKVAVDADKPLPPKGCDSVTKEGFEALEAEFDGVDDNSETLKLKLDLPPEDEPVAAFESPQLSEDDLPVVDVPIVADEYEDSPEDK